MEDKKSTALVVLDPMEKLKRNIKRRSAIVASFDALEMAASAAFSGIAFAALSKTASNAVLPAISKKKDLPAIAPSKRSSEIDIDDKMMEEVGLPLSHLSKKDLAEAYLKLKKRIREKNTQIIELRRAIREDKKERKEQQDKAIELFEKSLSELSAIAQAQATPPVQAPAPARLSDVNLADCVFATSLIPAGCTHTIEIDSGMSPGFEPNAISLQCIDPHSPGTNLRLVLKHAEICGVSQINASSGGHGESGILSDVLIDPVPVSWDKIAPYGHGKLRLTFENPNAVQAKVFVQIWGKRLDR